MAGSSSGGDVVEISCYSHRLAGRRHHGGGPHKPGRHHGSSCSGPRPIRPAHITRRELKCYCETTITAPNHSQQRELQCEVTEIQRPPTRTSVDCVSRTSGAASYTTHTAQHGARYHPAEKANAHIFARRRRISAKIPWLDQTDLNASSVHRR